MYFSCSLIKQIFISKNSITYSLSYKKWPETLHKTSVGFIINWNLKVRSARSAETNILLQLEAKMNCYVHKRMQKYALIQAHYLRKVNLVSTYMTCNLYQFDINQQFSSWFYEFKNNVFVAINSALVSKVAEPSCWPQSVLVKPSCNVLQDQLITVDGIKWLMLSLWFAFPDCVCLWEFRPLNIC